MMEKEHSSTSSRKKKEKGSKKKKKSKESSTTGGSKKQSVKRTKTGSKRSLDGSRRKNSKRRSSTSSEGGAGNKIVRERESEGKKLGGLPVSIWRDILTAALPPMAGSREGRERLRMMLVCKDWHKMVWAVTTDFDYQDKPKGCLKVLAKRKRKKKKSKPLQSFRSDLKDIDDSLFSWIATSFCAVTRLELSHCDRVTDGALKSVGTLHQLNELSLAFLRVTDAGMGAALVDLRLLRRLSLTQTEVLKGSFLNYCCASALEELDLTDGKGLAVSSLSSLAGLTRLTSLVLMRCGSGVDCTLLDHLPPSVESLKVSGFLLKEKAVAHLSEQPRLRELALSFTFFNQKRLKALSMLTSVKRLDMIDVRESNFLQEIGSLTDLDHLRIVARFYASRFQGSDLAPLTNLAGLTSLCLDTSGPELDGLSYLSQLRSLNTVTLSIPIKYDNFQFLEGNPSLHTLHVVRCEGVEDKAFKNLTSLTELHTTCDDPESKGIQYLSSLKTLSFDNCRIDSLRFITHLSYLQTLRITACRSLKDKHIPELLPSSLPSTLTHLDLSFCGNVGDASVPTILQLTSLETLRVLGCTISSENLNSLDLRLTRLRAFDYPKRLTDSFPIPPPNDKLNTDNDINNNHNETTTTTTKYVKVK